MSLTDEQELEIYHNINNNTIFISPEIDTFIEVVEKDLLSSFSNIEEKAYKIAEKYRMKNYYQDEITEDNFEDAIELNNEIIENSIDIEYTYSYNIYPKMKQDFLNMVAVWLYHIFEKDCKNIFSYTVNNSKKYLEITKKKNKPLLESFTRKMGLVMNDTSDWNKINTELRLISNAVKHRDIKPYLKRKKPNLICNEKIQITFEEIIEYANAMKSLWAEYFDKSVNIINDN